MRRKLGKQGFKPFAVPRAEGNAGFGSKRHRKVSCGFKCGFVLILTAYHIWMAGYAAALARGERRLDGKRLRLLNEVPGVAAVLIVTLVIVKPF